MDLFNKKTSLAAPEWMIKLRIYMTEKFYPGLFSETQVSKLRPSKVNLHQSICFHNMYTRKIHIYLDSAGKMTVVSSV